MARKAWEVLRDLAVTLALWTYLFLSFALFWWIPYVLARLTGRGSPAFQAILAVQLRAFFRFLGLLIPGYRLEAPREELAAIRGSVIVCNHLSFLDPVLLLSLTTHTVTVSKPQYYHFPLFSWLLRNSGFVSLEDAGEFLVSGEMEELRQHLARGGNLLVFPEGTRSRDGRLGSFRKGAFFLARAAGAGLVAFRLEGTGAIYQPERFLFHVRGPKPVRITRLGGLTAEELAQAGGAREISARVRKLYDEAD